MVSGPSRQAYTWVVQEREEGFKAGFQIATRNASHGYKNAIGDQLDEARAVLDAFHVVKLSTQVIDDVQRRAQRDTSGHRVSWGDPL